MENGTTTTTTVVNKRPGGIWAISDGFTLRWRSHLYGFWDLVETWGRTNIHSPTHIS